MDFTPASKTNLVAMRRPDRALFDAFFGAFRKILSAIRRSPLGKVAVRRERRLRLCETVSLGDRRMVALIQLDDQPMVVGVTGHSITLLAQPPAAGPQRAAEPVDFDEILSKRSGDAT
ncbi:MAG TPA: flagellar biosynthetic protein FliO [Candidatus Aquilonibacter sp.]|nr:flagellar biosynthetic protein FliO [Candidatus Aquilonibacter sp.]